MHPILLKIGGLTIYSWGFFVALAFFIGILYCMSQSEKHNIPKEMILDGAIYVLIFSIIGSRVFYVIGFWHEYRYNILKIFAVWEGGLVFYGGIIFAFIALYFWSRINKVNLLNLLDLISPSVAIGYSIGRIGCFLNGCCYGTACNLPFAVHFPGIEGFVHPTQIYSSIAGLLIFVVLIFVREHKKFDGQVFVVGLILYSVYRFINEFFRHNVLHWAFFSPSQWISLLLFFICLAVFFKKFNLQK